MDHFSPDIVHQQVKKNVFQKLMKDSQVDPLYQRELYEFLIQEDVRVDGDFFLRTVNSGTSTIAFTKVMKPAIKYDNPKPVLEGIRPHHWKAYFKLHVRYFSMKFLLKFLPRILTFHSEVTPVAVVRPKEKEEVSQ